MEVAGEAEKPFQDTIRSIVDKWLISEGVTLESDVKGLSSEENFELH